MNFNAFSTHIDVLIATSLTVRCTLPLQRTVRSDKQNVLNGLKFGRKIRHHIKPESIVDTRNNTNAQRLNKKLVVQIL